MKKIVYFVFALLLVSGIILVRQAYLGSRANYTYRSTPNGCFFNETRINMAETYRNYLQSAANAGDNTALGLLQVVGDDAGVDQGFLAKGQNLYGFNDATHVFNLTPAQVQAANQQYYSKYLGGGQSSGGGGSSVSPALNSYYDSLINNYQGQLDVLPSQQKAATDQVYSQYNLSRNPIETGYVQGQRNLNEAQQTVDKQRAQSLQQIADQVKSQVGSYNNQLGTYGAGNSSASDLIRIALGNSASKNRAGVVGSASDQTKKIGNQLSDLQTSYQQSVDQLDAWKQNKLNDLATQFASQQQQIRQQMAGASAQRLASLAQAGQATAQQYLDQLAQLQAQVNAGTQSIIQAYQQIQAPQGVGIPEALQQFGVTPVTAGNVGQISIPNSPSASETSAAPLIRKLDQTVAPAIGV